MYAVKANPNIIDEIGNIPLDYARNNDIRDLLLAMGSNPNHKNYLIYALQNKNARFFESLLEMGANVNKANEQGKTPIFYATTKEEIQKLINCGANINHTDKKGLSPILYFALKYNKEMVEFLKQCGAYSVSPINGETVFSSYELYRTYNSWLSKQTCKNIAFTGMESYEFYGVQSHRDQLKYNTLLTKEKIDKIMQQQKDISSKMNAVYKLLKTAVTDNNVRY